MQRKYSRKLSFNERSFLITDRLSPPTLNQFIFEGSGEFIPGEWQRAAVESSLANPGTRVALKGMLSGGRWVENDIFPRVRKVDGSQWDGRGPENAPFLQTAMCPNNGPVCEILLLEGNPQRVVFRSHHAVMDGRGTMSWIEDVFASLQGRMPVGSSSALTDEALMRSLQNERRKPAPYRFTSATGMAKGLVNGSVWQRVTVYGKHPSTLGKIACAASEIIRENGGSDARFAVPVDLRPRIHGTRSPGNLTNIIYIMVDKESTPESVAEDIKKQKSGLLDCCFYEGDRLMYHLPLWVMTLGSSFFIKNNHRKNRYPNSGIISNMGNLPLDDFYGGGFRTERWFGIPAGVGFVPFNTFAGKCTEISDPK